MAKKSEEEVRASNKAKQARYEAKNKVARKATRKILKTQVQAARVEEILQNALQHHDLGIRLWRHSGMGSKEDKVVKEWQVWYFSITYIILGEVGDEITMEKHQSKRQGEEVERVKTIKVKEGASLLRVIH